MKNNNQARRGIALIWMVIFLMLFVGFVGLACDTLWMTIVHHQLQNAADASALAGVRWVRDDQTRAREAARDIALANYGGTAADGSTLYLQADLNEANNEDGDIVLGSYSRITGVFTRTTSNPNAVKVVARRTASSANDVQPLVFGKAFGTVAAAASRPAIAYLGGGLGAGLLVLDLDDSCALTFSGNSTSSVINGSIQVNSNHANAVCTVGNSSIVIGDEMNVTGGTNFHNSANVQVTNINTGMPIIPDPLIDLLAPAKPAPAQAATQVGNTKTYYHGYHPGGITTNANNTDYVFEAGIYYIEGGLNLNGGKSVTAEGVFFYVATGSTEIGANTKFDIEPMDFGTYEHITIFQARDNFADAKIDGGSDSALAGTLYFPKNHCLLIGNGGNFGTQVIANTLKVQGNGNLNIQYDGWFQGSLANRVMLVK